MRFFFRCFSVPIFFCFICVSFVGYLVWKEYKINDILVEESLQGNRYAIAILTKYERHETRREDRQREPFKGMHTP